MAKIPKKEFAELCGLTTGNLGNYIKRGHVVCVHDLIDTTNPTNLRFLEKRSAKDKADKQPAEGQKPKKTTAAQPKGKEIPDIEDLTPEEVPSYEESERKLKYLDTLKREKEIEKLQIDIDKKKGVVVPSELIKPVFLQHNQNIVQEFKNTADEIVRTFSKKHSLGANEVAEIKGELVACINSAIKKAVHASISQVKNIINEHSIKKEVGEHG